MTPEFLKWIKDLSFIANKNKDTIEAKYIDGLHYMFSKDKLTPHEAYSRYAAVIDHMRAIADKNLSGIELIAWERQRQLSEGWTTDHDSRHINGELAKAAGCYAFAEMYRNEDSVHKVVPYSWPFDDSLWKQTPENRIHELAKAGAFIIAEIDRLIASTLPNT